MIPSFRIGGDSGIDTPEEIQRQRLIAAALLRNASDTSPTDMWGGVARLGEGVISALVSRRANKSEKRGRDDANTKYNAIIQKLMGAQAAPAGGDATFEPTPYEAQGIPDPRSPQFTIQDDRNLPVGGGYGQPMPQPAPQEIPPHQRVGKSVSGRPLYQEGGHVYSEKTVTFPIGDKWITFPSIDANGNQMSEDAVVEFVRKNGPIDPITGEKFPVFNSLQEAEAYARQRSATRLPPQPSQNPMQAMPQGADFQAAAQEVDALPMDEIMQLMSNPYLTEAQGNILNMVVKSKFDRGSWVNLGDGRIMQTSTGEIKDLGQRINPLDDEYKRAQIEALRARGQIDPLEQQKTQAEIARIQADTERLQNQPDNSLQAQIAERSAVAKQMGIPEGTPEFQTYVLNGELPRPQNDRATSTQLKELWQSQDEIPVLDNTINSLAQAKELNDKTFTGYTAGARGWAGTSGIPGANMLFDENAANATREFGQLMSYEAIKSMSQTLKGATTDRELQQFVELLANPSTPPDIRARTIDRMMTLAKSVKRIKEQRIQELGGDAAPNANTPAPPASGGLKQKYGLE